MTHGARCPYKQILAHVKFYAFSWSCENGEFLFAAAHRNAKLINFDNDFETTLRILCFIACSITESILGELEWIGTDLVRAGLSCGVAV